MVVTPCAVIGKIPSLVTVTIPEQLSVAVGTITSASNTASWTTMPIIGWGSKIIKDPTLPGTVWAMTDSEIQRTNGVDVLSIGAGNFPGSASSLTGLVVEQDGTMWTGTWTQFTSAGSTLIKYNPETMQSTVWSHDEGWPFPGEHVRPLTVTPDGRIWMQYDSEFPSTVAGIFAYDGVNIDIYPSAPGGFPDWNVLPNSTIQDVEVKIIDGGYELWLSCLGRGIAVLTVLNNGLSTNDLSPETNIAVLSAHPNPASEKVQITFNNKVAGLTNVSVYDLMGRKVTELMNSNCDKGVQTLHWNFASPAIQNVVYLVSIVNAITQKSIKVVVK